VRIALLVAVVALAGALLYGYWHVSTHGSLSITVDDVSDRGHPRAAKDAQLRLLGEDGHELAQARSDDRYGTIFLTKPEKYACHASELNAPGSAEAAYEWQVCFERQSTWLVVTWIGKVRHVELRSGACRFLMPVSVSAHPEDWWLWWIPLRHVGGKPYTLYSVTIQVDRNRCEIPE
jgi:hypothetical protein